MSRRRLTGIAIHGALIAASLVMLYPLLWMLASSLKPENEIFGSVSLLPSHIDLDAYVRGWAGLKVGFGRFFWNSLVIAALAVIGNVLSCSLTAYAFARLRFPGRDWVLRAYLSLLLAPAIVLVLPRYLLINALGWVDSYQGLISTELVSVWGIFLLRQCFLGIPRHLEDAARLEGATEWTIFWRVVLPLSRPGLAALALLAFVDQWKSFLWPLVATRSTEMRVLEVGLADFRSLYAANEPYQLAAALVVMAPLFVICFVAQRHLVRGIALATRAGAGDP
jgi:multiple sugar transport system permease protein